MKSSVLGSALAAERERPILFSGPMVRAILDDRKTVTRRVVKRRLKDEGEWWTAYPERGTPESVALHYRCPYGLPGDRLWVRETWTETHEDPNDGDHLTYRWVHYRATPHKGFRVQPDRAPVTYLHPSAEPERVAGHVASLRWRPSIHMPRWASRITLEVTDVRAERLQEITEAEVVLEGYRKRGHWWDVGMVGDGLDTDAVGAFHISWNRLNEKRGFGFEANPWVWRIAFRRVSA